MRKIVFVAVALSALAGSQALADTHYMYCYGGGRAGLYYSAVFAVPESVKSDPEAKVFSAFVKSKYGVTISSQCHRDGSKASSDSAKKITEDSDQKSKYPSKLIETGWKG